MDAFLVAVNAVTPYLIYLGLGYLFKKAKLMDEAFYNKLNQVIFRSFFPITMFYNTHDISFDGQGNGRLVSASLLLLLVVVGLSFFLVPRFSHENPRRGVIIQGIFRSNSVLYAIGFAETLFGQEGAALASILVALLVPLYNVITILVFEYFRGNRAQPLELVKKIFQNPLFLGGVIGVCFSALPVRLPGCVEDAIAKLSGTTTPLALMVLGGTIHIRSIRKNLSCIAVTLTIKMLLVPAVAVAIGWYLGFAPMELFVFFILFGTPIAVNSYTMAENMGGDGELAGELVAVSTVVSMFTLFGWIYFLRITSLI